MQIIRPLRWAAAPDRLRRRWRRGITLATTTATALVGWVLAVPVAGTALDVDSSSGRERVSSLDVVLSAASAGAAAWLLLAVLELRASRVRLWWTVAACGSFVLSLLGPLRASSDRSAATLLALHTAVALMLLWGMGGSARDGGRR